MTGPKRLGEALSLTPIKPSYIAVKAHNLEYVLESRSSRYIPYEYDYTYTCTVRLYLLLYSRYGCKASAESHVIHSYEYYY